MDRARNVDNREGGGVHFTARIVSSMGVPQVYMLAPSVRAIDAYREIVEGNRQMIRAAQELSNQVTRLGELGSLKPPARIASLPVCPRRKIPVPWFVAWEMKDGKREPEFRLSDPEKILRAINESRCWVCGDRLGRFKVFITGPVGLMNGIAGEPPSHRDCAIYSALYCPFLARPHMRRRSDELERVEVTGTVHHNPGVMILFATERYEAERASSGVALFKPGPIVDSVWITEGRLATRAEVISGLRKGLETVMLPAVLREGSSISILQEKVNRVWELLPPEEDNVSESGRTDEASLHIRREEYAMSTKKHDPNERIVDKPGLRPPDHEDGQSALERAVDGPDGALAKKALEEERKRDERVGGMRDKQATDQVERVGGAAPVVGERTETSTTASVTTTAAQLAGEAGGPDAPQQAVVKPADAPREPNQDAPAPRHHQPGARHNVDAEQRPAVDSDKPAKE